MAKAADAPLGGQRLGKGLAQNNARVLDGVVAVHLPVAYGFHLEAKVPVDGKGAEHVVKKAHPGGDGPLAPVQAELQGDFRLVGLSVHGSVAFHHLPSSAAGAAAK